MVAIASIWSGVSSKGKAAANCRSRSLSPAPSAARDLPLGVELEQLVGHLPQARFTRALVRFHELPPSWSRRGAIPSMPLYFCTWSIRLERHEEPLAAGVGDLHHLARGRRRRAVAQQAGGSSTRRRRRRHRAQDRRTGRCRGRRAPRSRRPQVAQPRQERPEAGAPPRRRRGLVRASSWRSP
jgi:hypothetical protein